MACIQCTMKLRHTLAFALLAALLPILLAQRASRAAAQETPAVRVPVIVELFTSEGCSSCPPADALIARLAKTQPVPGAEIIPLKLHVDYWNRLGWTDPFSSAAFSERQAHYADSIENSSVYTPQMIVDGQVEFVGSSEAKALRAIAAAAHSPKPALEVRVDTKAGNTVTVQARVPPRSGRTPGAATDIFLAVTEDNLHSDVKSGENAGRSFDHVAVVRLLIPQVRVRPTQQDNADVSFTFALKPAWKREHLRAVVFVQEEKSRRILAAASLPLATSH